MKLDKFGTIIQQLYLLQNIKENSYIYSIILYDSALLLRSINTT